MSYNLSSDLGTTTPSIAIVKDGNQGKVAGVPLHFATFGNSTTPGTMAYAIAQEQANSSSSLIWVDGTSITNGTEVGVTRTWNRTALHARKVKIGTGFTYTLVADTNQVLIATGFPSTGAGNDNDLSYDSAGTTIYLRTSGSWASLATIGTPSLKTVNGNSLIGTGDILVGNGVTSTPTSVAYATAIPLDTPSPGKTMTLGAPRVNVSTNTVLTVATGVVTGGTCKCIFVFDGTHTLDYTTNFKNPTGFIPKSTVSGARISLTFVEEDGDIQVYGQDLSAMPALPFWTAQSAPSGSVGSAYSYNYVATGAASYALASGTLPAGLALSSSGLLSGTTTTAATSTFTVNATNITGSTPSISQSIAIRAAITSGQVLMEDAFPASSSASTFAGRVPASNFEGSTWSLGYSSNTILAAGGANLTQAFDTREYFSITSTKAYTLSATFAVPGISAILTVRDNGGVAGGSNYIRLQITKGVVAVVPVVNGSQGSGANMSTNAWSDNAQHKLEIVMMTNDTAQLKVDGVALGSPFAISGSAFGFSIGANQYENAAPAIFSDIKATAQ